MELLSKLQNELRFLLISSQAELKSIDNKTPSAVESTIPGLYIDIEKLEETKCERCWHRSASVGENSEHPDICSRCVENITTESGESREFA